MLPKEGLGRDAQAGLLRDVVRAPFRLLHFAQQWRTANDGAARRIAEEIECDRTYELLPFVADALLDAGCDCGDLLSHLQGPGPHVRGCWGLDVVLGKF
jgi:hypothetical protein